MLLRFAAVTIARSLDPCSYNPAFFLLISEILLNENKASPLALIL